jgi:hypothetical protein
MQAPVGIMLLHRTMVQEELDRHRHQGRTDLPRRQAGPLMAIRAGIGRTLIAAGTRLAAEHERIEPAVGRLSAAR